MNRSTISKTLFAVSLAVGLALTTPSLAENWQQPASNAVVHKVAANSNGFSSAEILNSGHSFFGNAAKGLAQAIESVFAKNGRPQGYIIGEEGAGAIIGGLRYGEGTLFLKNGTSKKVYWQGPSIGLDIGGNGSRTLVLVYNIDHVDDILDRFVGLEGSAYLIGGLGVNYQTNEKLTLAPIRTGVGARLGASIGYLKYTFKPTWNPF